MTYQDLETPCFILDRKELEDSCIGFRTALAPFFREAIVGYSVKTNSLPYSMKVACQSACYAEVVSYDEYQLALACGFEKNRIIYNGPMKSKDTFLDAIRNGAIVNIETFREIEWLRDLPQGESYGVGIRINVNLSNVSPDDSNHEDDDSRFGFSYESGDLRKAVEQISSVSCVRITGVHIHRTSKTRSLECYKNIINYAMPILKKLGISVDYVDVGGGYFGKMPNKPLYSDYANVINETLARYIDPQNTTIIVEPGNALVAGPYSYLISVFDVKQHDGQYYVTTDGTRNDVDPFFRKTTYFYEVEGPISVQRVSKQIVSGCTCLENDRLFDVENTPLLTTSNRLYFKWVGAYTMTLSPMFIRFLPNVYVKEDNEYTLVRSRWTAEQQMNNSIL
ncbi:MAG: diaminopimelate decarboxylase [Bacteroidales bacterium]|nr:diaminopimelate decarboxylase [Bacteroidales bacterium]